MLNSIKFHSLIENYDHLQENELAAELSRLNLKALSLLTAFSVLSVSTVVFSLYHLYFWNDYYNQFMFGLSQDQTPAVVYAFAPTLLLLLLFTSLAVYHIALAAYQYFRTFSRPGHLPVSKTDYPELYKMIDEVWKKSGHNNEDYDLFVFPDVNAYAGSARKYIAFGPRRQVIGIGLPLLQYFSESELKAIMAHEIGHLIGAHSERKGHAEILTFILERLILYRWVPGFIKKTTLQLCAVLFSLKRRFELEADELEYDLTKKDAVQRSTVKFQLLHTYMEKAIDGMVRRLYAKETPRDQFRFLYAKMAEIHKSSTLDKELYYTLTCAKSECYVYYHPSCNVRLKRIGPKFSAREALKLLLDQPESSLLTQEKLHKLIDDLDAQNASFWTNHYKSGQKRQRRLSTLQRIESKRGLLQSENWEKIDLINSLQGTDASYPLIQKHLEEYPKSGLPYYHLALFEINSGHFEKAIEHLLYYLEAFDLGPSSAYYNLQLAYYCIGQRKFARAAAHNCRLSEAKFSVPGSVNLSM